MGFKSECFNKEQAQGVKWPKYWPWLFFTLSSLAGPSASCLPPHPSRAQGVTVPSPRPARSRPSVAGPWPPGCPLAPTGCLLPGAAAGAELRACLQPRGRSCVVPFRAFGSPAKRGLAGSYRSARRSSGGKGGQCSGGAPGQAALRGPCEGSESESQVAFTRGGLLQSGPHRWTPESDASGPDSWGCHRPPA